MNTDDIYRRYQELQDYVGWSAADAEWVQALSGLLEPHLAWLVDDFYATIERHPAARQIITGGAAQIERLKGTLRGWLLGLLGGVYDQDYVVRRWRAGRRHLEIGLSRLYANAALARLRVGLQHLVMERWRQDTASLQATLLALNKLLDLDLAIIEDAYQHEYAERLQRAERLAAIGQVAGGVAHELRNPLNVIKTSVYYLLHARQSSPDKRGEHLQRVDRHVNLADHVITALANFAKQPMPSLQPFSLQQCLQEALEYNPLPENIQVALDCPPTLPPVLADPEQVRIALGNLLRNAGEAMAEGGRLTLRAYAAGDGIELEVSDTGVGIAPDQLSQVMEPLYSTKARGLGLGLAIARSILEKNKGRLRVASAPGRGSTFTVTLQAAPVARESRS